MKEDDLPACKHFLLDKNNAGELNIDNLCVVGAGMGATLAVNWADQDWRQPVFLGLRTGQFVKGLVLLSPEYTSGKGGLLLGPVVRSPPIQKLISIFIIYGDKGRPPAAVDGAKLHKALEPFRKFDKPEDQDLFKFNVDTTLQGTELLVPELGLDKYITTFIDDRIVKKKFPWKEQSR
jgi:hypothetical protein